MTGLHLATWGHRLRAERQPMQATVEFALVIMLLLAMLVFIFEGARLVGTYFALANGAAEGARIGAVAPSAGRSVATIDGSIRGRVHEMIAPWASVPDESITICRRATPTAGCDPAGQATGGSAGYVEVTVSYQYQFVPYAGGWLGRQGIPLTGFSRASVD